MAPIKGGEIVSVMEDAEGMNESHFHGGGGRLAEEEPRHFGKNGDGGPNGSEGYKVAGKRGRRPNKMKNLQAILQALLECGGSHGGAVAAADRDAGGRAADVVPALQAGVIAATDVGDTGGEDTASEAAQFVVGKGIQSVDPAATGGEGGETVDGEICDNTVEEAITRATCLQRFDSEGDLSKSCGERGENGKR